MASVETKNLKEVMPLLKRSALSKSTLFAGGSVDALQLQVPEKEDAVLLLRRHGLEVVIPTVEDEPVPFGPVFVDDIQKQVKLANAEAVGFAEDEDESLIIQSGKRALTVRKAAVSKDNVPEQPAIDTYKMIAAFNAEKLVVALERVWPFISGDEVRPSLNGVRFNIQHEQTVMDATDSYRAIRHRMSETEIDPDYAAGAEMVFRMGDLKVLKSLLKRSEYSVYLYEVSEEESTGGVVAMRGFAESWSWTLYMKPHDGTFPEVDRLAPERSKMVTVSVDKEQLSESARVAIEHLAVKGVEHSHCLNLEIGREQARITGESPNGKYEDVVPASGFDDMVVRVSLHGQYLQDALGVYNGRMVELAFQQNPEGEILGLKPIYIGSDVIQMPMRNPSAEY